MEFKIDGIKNEEMETVAGGHSDGLKYDIDGYHVEIKKRNVIGSEESKSNLHHNLKEIIKEMANSPDLQVFKDGTRVLNGDFDKFRNKLWKNSGSNSSVNNFEGILKSLSQNIFTRVHQLETVIETIRENKHYDEWHKKINDIKSIEHLEQKTNEIDNLFKEIYTKL